MSLVILQSKAVGEKWNYCSKACVTFTWQRLLFVAILIIAKLSNNLPDAFWKTKHECAVPQYQQDNIQNKRDK